MSSVDPVDYEVEYVANADGTVSEVVVSTPVPNNLSAHQLAVDAAEEQYVLDKATAIQAEFPTTVLPPTSIGVGPPGGGGKVFDIKNLPRGFVSEVNNIAATAVDPVSAQAAINALFAVPLKF